ncbi:uncharacterized protein LOC110714326 [Chenopodium quinoa]|uniref:uncharacterized protein LOC110714326 n=1 Tax=Chenopodium quinoa TaxID=63459 RepID=UPI000B7932F1|nr:uncharacterized protein LOC110714326 [Chenopodium quinoa]
MENSSSSNNMVTDLQQSQQQQLSELIQSLEQATLMAKQLPATSDPDHHRLIFSSLSSAQLSLSSFLNVYSNNIADNSVSSAAVAGDEPMVAADDGDDEQNSKDSSMERMEEKLRDMLYIQNKRPKRPLSPSSIAAVERRHLEEREIVEVAGDVDPVAIRLRNLDLVYQFHG